MMRVLFTAISGTDVNQALTKIAVRLGIKASESIIKFETYLFSAHEKQLIDAEFEEVEDEMKRIREKGGIQILLGYPKSYIRTIWKEAFNVMLNETRNHQNALFMMHSIYYQTQNREFFAAYDADLVKELNVDTVITLIDDIYDCHARLREDDGVMSDDMTVSVFKDMDERARARINDLATILDWRSKEIIIAEQIASILNVMHYVVAVKHPVTVLESIIQGQAKTVYISHPITQVRRLQKDGRTKEAAEIIGQIEELSVTLLDDFENRVTAIFPTSIDELIIHKPEESPFCMPRLNERWPLLERGGELLWGRPALLSSNPLDIENIYFDIDGKPKQGCSAEALAAIGIIINDILKPAIANHIDSRDHFLVDQCDAICVFRPYFDGNYSSGVAEEISHRTLRFKIGVDSSAKQCIVYSPKDDLAKVRLAEVLSEIEEQTEVKFLRATREQLVDLAKSDSKIWSRLRNLEEGTWDGGEIKALFKRAQIKVILNAAYENGPLGKAKGLQYKEFEHAFWESLTPFMNSHPLERADLLLMDIDQWYEEDLTPSEIAQIVAHSMNN